MSLPTESVAFDPMELLESMPVGAVHLRDERIDYANQAMVSILGWSKEQLLGHPMLDFLSPAESEKVLRRHRARLRGEPILPLRYEIDLRHADGALVRVEIEPRVVGPGRVLVLMRDASAGVQESALLATLSELALQVQRERTVADVLTVAGRGLRALDMHVAVLRVDAGELVAEYFEAGEAVVRAVEAAVGRPWREWRLPLGAWPAEARVHAEQRSVFRDSFPELLLRFEREHGCPSREDVRELLVKAGASQAVFCPLHVGGQLWGYMDVVAANLSARDAAAVGLFASKVASALEVARTIAALEQRNGQLEALQAISRAGSEPDLARLAPTLARLAAESTASDLARIYLLDPRRSELVLFASHGSHGSHGDGRRVLEIDSPTGRLALGLEPRAARTCELPEELARALGREGVEQVALVPLHLQGRLAGVLDLGRRRAEPYSAQDLRFGDQLGGQVAILLENARLYADVNRRIGQLTVLFDLSHMGTEALEVKPLVERVIDRLFATAAVDGIALHLLDGERLVICGARGSVDWDQVRELPLDHDSLCGRAALERRTQVTELAQWPRTGLPIARKAGLTHGVAVPLVATERLIGVLSVVRKDDHRFAQDELSLLESSAAHVATAIERARLFERERRRVEELQMFLDIGRVVSASLDLEKVLELSAASMTRMADATHSFVYLLDKDGRTLRGVAVSSPEHRDHFRTVRIGLEEGAAAALAARTRGPVRVEDARSSQHVRRDLTDYYGPRSLLALPLLVRGEAIGAVLIADTQRIRGWSEGQIERATAVARQVAVAASNARLYEDLKHSYDELARAQQELVKRERLAAIGELSAVVAHEVRNPLGVIFNSLGSLRRVLKPTGDAAMLLDIVGEEADRLNSIVGELLDYTRPNDPKLKPESLGDLLTGAAAAAAPLAERSGVSVVIERDGAGMTVPADARMMRQALLNLVINAVQATPRGGTVRLAAGMEVRNGRPMARLEVLDRGPGVPGDLADRVFLPFVTTKASGTGLGLAVVKRIVDAHHGEVALESPPEGGARFVVRLSLEPR